jgi:photosystem II stability/assembly factor-like uncharacterized protein
MRFFFLFFFYAISVSAQMPSMADSKNMYEYEQKFAEWRAANPNQKGWKWLARQQEEVIRRVDSAGNLPSSNVLIEENNKIKRMARTMAQSAWTPAGPYGNTNLFGIGRASCIAFHPKDSLIHYLGFGQGGIWKTTNGGKSYTPIGDKLPVLRISSLAIDPKNPETIYASVGDFSYIGYDLYSADRKRNTYYGLGVYKSTDGGKNWAATGLSRKLNEQQNSLTRSLWINPESTAEVVVASIQGIQKTKDGGQTWLKVSDFLTSQIIQHPTKTNVLFASGIYIGSTRQGEACILKSIDAGNTWAKLETGIQPRNAQRIEIGISASNPTIMYAVACNLSSNLEGFYRSDNEGLSWKKSASRTQILSDSPTGTYGQGMYDLTILVHPTNPENVIVGGLVLFETKDGGNAWSQMVPYTGVIHPDQHYLAYNQLNKTFYLCNDGGLYASKNINTPNKWQFISNDINVTSCYRLGVSDDGSDIITGAQDNNSFWKDETNPWVSLYGGDGMECLILPNEQTLYMSAQYGSIAYLSKGRYYSIFPPNDDSGEWTTPFSSVPATSEIYIAGGDVYKIPYEQQRTALKKISNFPVIAEFRTPQLSSALAVSKSSPATIYVAKRSRPLYGVNSELFYTANGGTNWLEIGRGQFGTSYITSLSIDADNAEHLWVALSNFNEGKKLYMTSDAGKTWQNVSYNLPNVPVNSVVFQPEEKQRAGVLYVGMDIGVYYLIEGESEWKLLNENLPNVIVSELEINAATNQLFAATFGRGVWQTDLVNEKSKAANSFYEMQVIASPNPVSDFLTVKSNFDDVFSIRVINGRGEEISQTTLKKKELRYGKTIDLSHIPSGLYFLVLSNGNLNKSVRILKE